MDRDLVDQVRAAAARVVAGGAISSNGHGAAIRPGTPAVLLANHGVRVFHRTAELAILVGGAVEEAAEAAINAAAISGAVEPPRDLRAAALQRAMTFDAAGTMAA